MAAAIPYIPMAMSMLSSGAKSQAQTQGAQASAEVYRLQAMQNRIGAATERQWARYNAAAARGEGIRQGQKIERAGERFLGKIAPQYAVAGVEMSGTPMDVMATQIEIIQERKAEVLAAGHQEANAALYKGDLAAYDRLVNADIQDFLAETTLGANAWRQAGNLFGAGYGFYRMGGFGMLGDLFGGGGDGNI